MKLRPNHSWIHWGSHGSILGGTLIFIGLATEVLEFLRIFNGPTNTLRSETVRYRISNNHWWPWSSPANIFGLLTFFCGIFGIITAYRRTYGSIFVFFTASFFSLCSAIFLIVYYSIIIGFYQSLNKTKDSSEFISFVLAASQLAFACLNVLISLISAIISGHSIDLCTPKAIFFDDIQPMPSGVYQNRF